MQRMARIAVLREKGDIMMKSMAVMITIKQHYIIQARSYTLGKFRFDVGQKHNQTATFTSEQELCMWPLYHNQCRWKTDD